MIEKYQDKREPLMCSPIKHSRNIAAMHIRQDGFGDKPFKSER